MKVDLGKWILIDKQGHSIQTTWQNFGYDSAVFGSITPEGRSRELIACVQDQKRIGFEIMDILGPKKLESRKNTKTSLKKVYFALGCILAMNLAIIIAMIFLPMDLDISCTFALPDPSSTEFK